MTDTTKLINWFAWQVCKKCPGYSFDDAHQEMTLVLIKAHKKYDPARSNSFVKFFEICLRSQYRSMVRQYVRRLKVDSEYAQLQSLYSKPHDYESYEKLCRAIKSKLSGKSKQNKRAIALFDVLSGATQLPDRCGDLTFNEVAASYHLGKDDASRARQLIKEAVKEVLR